MSLCFYNSFIVNCHPRAILTFLFLCCDCIKASVFSMHLHFNIVQQSIQISTRINSSSVHTYICVCFIRNVSNIQQSALSCNFAENAENNTPAALGPVYTKRQCQRCDNSAMTLAILFSKTGCKPILEPLIVKFDFYL